MCIGSRNGRVGGDKPGLNFFKLGANSSARHRSMARSGTRPGESLHVSAVECDASQGVLYVCDCYNSRVQKLRLTDGECLAIHCLQRGVTLRPLGICLMCPALAEVPPLLFATLASPRKSSSHVIVLDPQSLTRRGHFGNGLLHWPGQITEDDGFLYIVDQKGSSSTPSESGRIAVFTVSGELVRVIPLRCSPAESLSHYGRRRVYTPRGLAVAGDCLLVCGNIRVPDDELSDDEAADEEDDDGVIQVLTLQGSLREHVFKANSGRFGGMDVGCDEDGVPCQLFLTEINCDDSCILTFSLL